jgi:hypothetical protein
VGDTAGFEELPQVRLETLLEIRPAVDFDNPLRRAIAVRNQ